MSGNIVLTVDVREGTGKGAARAARREDLVPGVLYGGKLGPVSITLRGNEVRRALLTGQFLTNMLELNHEGETQTVIAREVQFHPVSDQPMHIDLYRVDEDSQINVEIPVRFINDADSPGLKRGGVLNVVRHEVELKVPAGNIPEFIEADLTGLEIGDSVHISAIKLPDGAEPTITDRDFTIATLQGSRAATMAEAEEGEAEQPQEEKEEAKEEKKEK